MCTNKSRAIKFFIGLLITIGVGSILYMAYVFQVQDFSFRPKWMTISTIKSPPALVEPPEVLYNRSVKKGCPFPELSVFSEPLRDFQTFPCLPDLPPSQQLMHYGKCVRTVNFPKDLLTNKAGCPMLRSGRGTPICTYPSKKDRHVSGSINAHGMWEKGLVDMMMAILRKDPGMVLFDAGCNVGVYTLVAALHGYRVISIDASYENLYLVSKSLTHGNLWKNVSLIWNAISYKHEMVVLRKEVDPNNVGGAEIDSNNKKAIGLCDLEVNAIILDDLKELFAGKKVYMKLDIQGQEHNLFKYGAEFFKMADVRYVQLEYVMHKGRPSGKSIIGSMFAYGFLPFADCYGKKPIKPSDEARWPFDMCFIKTNTSVN